MEIRDAYESDDRERPPGRPPVKGAHAKGDDLSLRVTFEEDCPEGWGRGLANYLDTWPDELPEIGSGPGARGAAESQTSGTSIID